jgi:DNA-binding SARP family transcriptional activator
VFVEDLGRIRVRIGERVLEASAMRRKVAALLAFLLTRPGYTAAREQVLENLWPDSPPDVGKNSLHQTVYFLRRELEPDYADYLSAGYVRLEGELVWLDPELVDSASHQFAERAASLDRDAAGAFEALSIYKGRFAPEFEYEDWAIATRDALHAAYLELVARALKHCAGQGDWLRGAATARLALAVDPAAEEIERNLIALYHHAGSHAAAAEQYAHFASAHRAEYGLEPPSLETLLTNLNPT